MLDKLIETWLSEPLIAENIVSRKHFPAKSGKMFDFPDWLHPSLMNALRENGIHHLYSHQLEALQVIQNGSHLLIVSGIASGKSLTYQIPILDSFLKDPSTCALFVFPTKALSYDQGEKLKTLVSKTQSPFTSRPFLVSQFDGDTPSSRRPRIIENAQFILTNPDMLHQSILPRHSRWSRFFNDLRYIVLDEIHVYRGIFGSHVANVMRRLKRIAHHYGAEPQFILTTGTIGDPDKFAELLVEEPLVKIEPRDSPTLEKEIWIYNPPVINPDFGLRRHPFEDAARLVAESIPNGTHSIIFCRSRKAVELLLIQLRERFNSLVLDVEEEIRSYRSGYLPALRREIEQTLRVGKVKCVIATNALELGIDIGGLDITFIIGFPGSISSTWQQFGRSGRNSQLSLGILILSDDPLDQYLAHHSEYFWESNPERVIINPDNPLILHAHLQCALYEVPISHRQLVYGNVSTELLSTLLDSLVFQGNAIKGSKHYYYTGTNAPHTFSIRSISEHTVQLILKNDEQQWPVGTVDAESAHWMVHSGAIYFHEGNPYLVENLDLERRIATLRTCYLDRITQPKINTQVVFLSSKEHQNLISPSGFTYQIAYGLVELSRQVEGYLVLDWDSRLVKERKTVDLPPRKLSTTAFWLTLSNELVEDLRQQGVWTNDPNQYGSDWENQKRLARQRDQYLCQLCGVPEKDRAHHVHHKIPFRNFIDPTEANRLENLITLCPSCHHKVEESVRIQSGLAALGYAFSHISPLYALCDRQDLGITVDPKFVWCENQPTILVFEQIPGGIGLAYRLYEIASQLLFTIKHHIRACSCSEGCPSCTGPIAANGGGGKREALALLERILA
ncbi:MAG: DEAD/DEAH box helicase [Anaerolineales bacterium]|nr:DEAD/DEAH box helicase [Anaerolineales bacterium]